MKELSVYLRKRITVTKKTNSWTYTVACSFACNSALAVSTVVGLFRSAHLLRNLPQTLFPRVLSWLREANPLLDRRIECSFNLFFELVNIFGMSPRVTAGAWLLSFSLSSRSVLKFHSVGTSLIRNFDVHFTKRWTFIFSDTCLTRRRLCE